VSLGDERTLGDGLSGQDTVIGDIEVVDLEARYRVEGTLGKGGMGAVLLATDTRLDRKVAIKRILGEAAGNRMAVQRFLTEAKSIAALNHPNIVQIYDYGRAKDGPFLIMEFVDGGSLLDRCRDGAMPLEDAVDLACQLCDGLAKAHDLGIIHRDIKPANVLLTKDGIPKLTDFGLAKAQAGDHGQTMTGAVLGTPDFMPPEQRQDASLVDARSDLWSLGATVYQMATGRSPKIIRFDLLPAELTKVLGKALEDAKDDRYQSARELRDALRATSRIASPPISALPATAGELAEGQCSACGTINTDASRKFCKKCAASLRAACLQCDTQIPVWDRICGECGGNQPNLTVVAMQMAEARKHLSAFDYASAIHAIELIPEPLRSMEAVQLLGEIRSREEESGRLIKEVAARVKRKEIDGLLRLVERAAMLRGDRTDLAKIQQQLTERRDLRLARGRAAMEAGDVKAAAAALSGADAEDLGLEGGRLLEQVRQAVELEGQLAMVVRDAKADGVVNPSEAAEIRRVGMAYLEVNPRSEKARSLVAQSERLITPPAFTNSVGISLTGLPAGTFAMGDAAGRSDEKPHRVTLTRPFYLGVHEVTNAQWKQVMGSVPSNWKDDDHPVEQVSWQEALEFCRKLSALPEERKAGRVYRLPTEAEWECACRAGATTRYSFGDDEKLLGDYGWFEKNSGSKTHPVGQKKPNAWGLYDMHGNVWEWCSDKFGDYPDGAVTDPKGPSSGSGRVNRGGSWLSSAGNCRSASRDWFNPSNRNVYLGFRLALSPSGGESPEAGK
jgi:formylglycine-generating enzyme required for sulfatase activity/predicted Ser/Thr protein kinase